MDESTFIVTSRRLFIMVMALIAPEFMITWAARQFFSARKTAADFNDTFGAKAHEDHQNIGEERAATLLPEITQSHGNSQSPSQSSSSKFTGRLHALGYRLLKLSCSPHRMDIDARVLRLDGRIPALRR